MRAGLSFSYPPISLLLRQPLSIKKSYAGAIQFLLPFFIYFSRILDSPQSRQNAKLFLQSSDGSPLHLLAGEGVGNPN
jgi:hypothetical protein